jgi:hypothetical protein
MLPILAFAFVAASHLTFDPTAIATLHCRKPETVGSFTFCAKAIMTFSRTRVDKPLPATLRINYSDGVMLQYAPARCRLKDWKRQRYECPGVLMGPGSTGR